MIQTDKPQQMTNKAKNCMNCYVNNNNKQS